MISSPAAQRNVEVILAWLDAHNRQDMKALDYMTDDVEILETPTGVVWRGRKDMENLAKLAYTRKTFKELTNIFATDDEVCVEYTAKAHILDPVSDFEKELGIHGISLDNAKPTVDAFELKVCFVCHMKDGKIDLAREYWDAASMARQFGIDRGEDADGATSPESSALTPRMILEERLSENIRKTPGIAAKVNAICLFKVAGPDGGVWYVDLTGPDFQIGRGTPPNVACTISIRDSDLVAIFGGRLSLQKAFVTGKLKLAGDLGVASALREVMK